MLELKNITVTYGKNHKKIYALKELDFELQGAEFVTVTGPSGSGKTTFLQVCGGMFSPTEGTVLFKGQELHLMDDLQLSHLRNSSIGFVFQSFNLVDYLSALENVARPLFFRGVSPEQRNAKALAVLELLGLGARAKHFPSELSGGECQRVAIARALVTEPDLIIADEPTGNLDFESGRIVMDTFARIHKEQQTSIILVTHNPWVAEFGARTIRIEGGILA